MQDEHLKLDWTGLEHVINYLVRHLAAPMIIIFLEELKLF